MNAKLERHSNRFIHVFYYFTYIDQSSQRKLHNRHYSPHFRGGKLRLTEVGLIVQVLIGKKWWTWDLNIGYYDTKAFVLHYLLLLLL